MARQYLINTKTVRFIGAGYNMHGKRSLALISPRSSESRIPLVVVDSSLKFDFYFQWRGCFGLYIRLPFIFLRWGCA